MLSDGVNFSVHISDTTTVLDVTRFDGLAELGTELLTVSSLRTAYEEIELFESMAESCPANP